MNKLKYIRLYTILIVLTVLCILTLNGCSAYDYASISKKVQEVYPGFLEGYLSPDYLPNSLEILPPPPEEGSPAFELDMQMSEYTLQSQDTSLWQQAIHDAHFEFPNALDGFSTILDMQISEDDTPYLYMLLRRTLTDANLSTFAAKSYYNRVRPFMVNEQPICTPEMEEQIRNNGSYPSGHTATGWTWALILCEIFPEHANAILKRGREYGESRIICNVHWYSDVVEGRFMGTSTVAALHGNSTFLHDIKMAKREIARLKSR